VPLQHFLVQSRYLGSRQVPAFLRSSTFGMRPTYGVCWFCPQCGEIWARLAVEGASYHQHWTESCPKHGGGAIDRECRFEWWPSALEADWPEEALRYVLLQELKLFEQEGSK
jgi:hypothetical protein